MNCPNLSRLNWNVSVKGAFTQRNVYPYNVGFPPSILVPNGPLLTLVPEEVARPTANWFLASNSTQLGRGADARGSGYAALVPVAIYAINYPDWHPVNIGYQNTLQSYRSKICTDENATLELQKYAGVFSNSTRYHQSSVAEAMQAHFMDTNVNEQLLCHGTSWDGAQGILTEGFKGVDPDQTTNGGDMFGKANYFAENPEKGDQYARGTSFDRLNNVDQTTFGPAFTNAVVRSGQQHQGSSMVFPMLINRVLLGCPAIVDACTLLENNETVFGTGPVFDTFTSVPIITGSFGLGVRKVPRTLSSRYNSCIVKVGGSCVFALRRYAEFVVYNNSACLPALLCLYARSATPQI